MELKTIVSIATKGDRPEQLEKALHSLHDQADLRYVYYNNDEIDYTDLSKFWLLDQLEEPCIRLAYPSFNLLLYQPVLFTFSTDNLLVLFLCF